MPDAPIREFEWSALRQANAGGRAPVPAFAAGYSPAVRADGQLWLRGEEAGCSVFVQPKAWSTMTFPRDAAASPLPDAGASNGVLFNQLQAHAGSVQTNESAFGQQLLAGTSAECRPDPRPEAGPSVSPNVLVLALAIVAGAAFFALKRRGS